jgi:hypothetical protein
MNKDESVTKAQEIVRFPKPRIRILAQFRAICFGHVGLLWVHDFYLESAGHQFLNHSNLK